MIGRSQVSDNKQEIKERKRKFYLAGSYGARLNLLPVAKRIEDATGWECTSRWLHGDHDKLPEVQCARDDRDDIYAADVLVVDMTYDSTRGGMWVEVGLALAEGMHIVVYNKVGRGPYQTSASPKKKPTVFLRMDGVQIFHSMNEVHAYLKAFTLDKGFVIPVHDPRTR